MDRYLHEGNKLYRDCEIQNNAYQNSLERRNLGLELERRKTTLYLSREEHQLREQRKQMQIAKTKTDFMVKGCIDCKVSEGSFSAKFLPRMVTLDPVSIRKVTGRLYASQNGMEIDKKSPDCRMFFVALMDHLKSVKTGNDEEAIHNEVVGQAHVESYTLKMFLFADNEDRAARFNKNVVKSFYTAGMLFDTLTVFGEMSEDIEKNRKYAKWKAAYIHKCLKNGETPIPGPMPEEGEEDEQGAMGGGGPIGFEQPGPSQPYQPQPGPAQPYQPGPSEPGPSIPSGSLNLPNNNQYPGGTPSGAHAPPSTPQDPRSVSPQPNTTYTTDWKPPSNPTGVQLTPADYQKAMKYCKYASSALQYEDSKTAIDNLTKALKLLSTGKDT